MHHRKLFLMVLVSLIHTFYAVRVDTNVAAQTTSTTDKSESADSQQPKAEALTLVIHKHVPLRPVKVIERKDDVVVIHTSKRAKRKQNSRRRRPSNQYRSKIRSTSSGSSFGGFKDFTSNDLRFPPFPPKNFKPSSSKIKNGPPKHITSYDYTPKSRRPPQRPKPPTIETISPSYGPPSINHVDSPFIQPVTLQQHQNNFPSFTINALESASSNNFFTNSNNDVSQFSSAIGSFPLGDGSNFNVPKTSYGEPIKSASSTPDTSSYQFNSNVANVLSQLNKNNNNNFPKLPSKYEESDFSTPTRHNPLNSNSFTSDFANIDFGDSKNILSTSNRQKNRFNKFNNYDYDFRNQQNPLIGLAVDNDDDDDEYDNLEYLLSTTRRPRTTTTTTSTTEFSTTKRYKKGTYGKRHKGKFPQDHNLDTDDLRDAFSESSSSDFHEIALNSEDFLNFDSQRNHRKSQSSTPLREIHSTLKAARKNPALRQAIGDDFQIVSIQKSLEKDPKTVDLFQRRHDTQQRFREFKVGGEINFSQASPVIWNGEMNSFPRNHRFS